MRLGLIWGLIATRLGLAPNAIYFGSGRGASRPIEVLKRSQFTGGLAPYRSNRRGLCKGMPLGSRVGSNHRLCGNELPQSVRKKPGISEMPGFLLVGQFAANPPSRQRHALAVKC